MKRSNIYNQFYFFRSSSSDIVRNTQDYYRSPGKIENYTPGHSSIAEKEAKQASALSHNIHIIHNI